MTVGAIGCTSAEVSGSCPDGAQASQRAEREALNGGANSAEYLRLSAAQERSVVRVLGRVEDGTQAMCAGTLVARDWVLTAAHCRFAEGVAFHVVLADVSVEVNRVVSHPDADAMLLGIADPAPEAIQPLALARSLSEDLRGRLMQLGGFSPALETTRAFAVEEVIGYDSETFTVSSRAYSGACAGDSGGPALNRAENGEVVVAGLLMSGSVSCWGEDTYLRVDRIAAWLESVIGAGLPSEELDCGELTGVGRCFDDVAAWCDSSQGEARSVRGERCGPGLACGWSSVAGGYRCVPVTHDPCRGISDVGMCESGDAVSCHEGSLRRNTCSQCDAECIRSPQSGRVVCVY